MWCKVILSILIPLIVECFPHGVSVIRSPNEHNSISGVNFIYFLGPSPTPYQISAVEEISNNYLTELAETSKETPLINHLFVQKRKSSADQSSPTNRHSHSIKDMGSFRKKRNADPSYKKSYGGGGGGGGGCCNTCGQCGGGGGNSGTYSHSQSSSSSSSGTYSSGYGKK